jgi:phosphonate transport system substrate-binding protein
VLFGALATCALSSADSGGLNLGLSGAARIVRRVAEECGSTAMAQLGLEPHRDFEVLVFDRLVGKHGDHIGGERDAARALVRGDCDAACMIDGNLLMFAQEGTLPAGSVRTLATTPQFDHRNFTVLESGRSASVEVFRELLLGMSYEDPDVRRLLDLEGLKRWVPGRTEGYDLLSRAVDRFAYLYEFPSAAASR